jgi:hypothetical protein
MFYTSRYCRDVSDTVHEIWTPPETQAFVWSRGRCQTMLSFTTNGVRDEGLYVQSRDRQKRREKASLLNSSPNLR